MVRWKSNKLLKTVLLTVCLIVLIPFAGCAYKGYSGKRTDLYTVAVNSVLWNLGHSYGADFAVDSQIEILETDKFGRTLFTYREKYYSRDSISFSALLVLQCSSDGYAYFYEDYNYLIKEQESHSATLQNFDESEKENLKSLNDWDKELDLSKCTKKKISRKKQAIPTDTNKIRKEVISQFNPLSSHCTVFLHLLTTDANANFIVYGFIDKLDDEDILFSAFVNSEGVVADWLIPDDLYNYQEELRSFKQVNGWVAE